MNRSTWLAGILILALTTTVQAHTHLKEAMPAEGSTVKASPDHIMLTFSEAARLTALTIQGSGEPAETLRIQRKPPPGSANDQTRMA